MNKKLLLVSLVAPFLLFSAAQAQTFAEWFNQKSTQKKYLLQQIAALQVYIGFLQKGYDIVGDGVKTIGTIKNGEFGLHQDFFNSLKNVSPAVQNNSELKATISLQSDCYNVANAVLSGSKKSGQFTEGEITYISRVCAHLLAEVDQENKDLKAVVTSGTLQMTDDERISRIHQIYAISQDQYLFLNSFKKDVNILAAERLREKQQTTVMKQFYQQSKNNQP